MTKNSSKWQGTSAAGHLRPLLDPRTRTKCVKNIVSLMRCHKKLDFDAVGVTGVSGILAGMPVAMALKKRLIVIRKKGDVSNSCRKLEGAGHEYTADMYATVDTSHRVALIDDLIDNGDTVNHMIKVLRNRANGAVHTVVAIFLYNPMGTEGECFGHAIGDIPVFKLDQLAYTI